VKVDKSYLFDGPDGIMIISFAAVSRAPWAEIAPFKKRMGWLFTSWNIADTPERQLEMKRSLDDISTDHGRSEPRRGSLRASIHYLRAQGLLGLVVMICFGWSLYAPAAETQSGNDHWINTWTAGPMPPWAGGPLPIGFFDQTVRQVVRISLGGDKVRVRLSNEFGLRPVEVGAAHLALAGAGGMIQTDTDRELTFHGKPTVTLLPGAPVLSDPVDLKVASLAHLAISLYFAQRAEVRTYHLEAAQTAYISSLGNFVGAEKMPVADTATSRFFLTGVMIEAPVDARVVVAFGDSITDGARSTPDTDNRWPDHLAERLSQPSEHGAVAVVNEGIGGNRVLSDGMGIKALARFDRDVLSQPSISHVVIMEGINDIGWPGTFLTPPEEPVTVEKIIAGYQQLIDRAHLRGIKVIGATLTPFEDSFAGAPLQTFYNPEKEKMRRAVNEWIRQSGAYDGVIDFDAVVRDPQHPSHIRADYDAGDHLHPNDAGYKAMGDSVDLRLLDGH
jgi:lysophospholipase L1-like esterase